MASSGSKVFGSGFAMLLMMQICASDFEAAEVKKWERMTVVIGNNMTSVGQRLEVRCHMYVINIPHGWDQEFQPFSLMPNETFEFPTLYASVRRGDKFACLFSTAYMKDVYFDLGPQLGSCNCVAPSRCFWQALDSGLWCSSSFLEKWIPLPKPPSENISGKK